MDRELGEFFVKFTTQGLSEVKSSIDDLSKKMDDLGDASDNATKKHEGFFSKIGNSGFGWIKNLVGLTSAVMALKTAWNQVADAAASTMTIYNQSMLAGTDPQTLERWQILARHKGLNAGEIFSDFRAGQDLLKQFEYAEITEDFNKVFGRVGLDSSAIIRSVNEGNLNAVFEMLNKALSKQTASGSFVIDSADADRVMKQLGFGDTMLSLLRIAELPNLLQNTDLIYTKDPELINAAAARTEARESLRDEWNKIWANEDLINAQTELLNFVREELLPGIKELTQAILGETLAILSNEGETEAEKKAGGWLKAITAGMVFAGAGVLGAPALGAAALALVGARAADWGHEKLLQYDWYKDIWNGTSNSDLWKNDKLLSLIPAEIQDTMDVPQWYAGMNMPQAKNEASATINLNGVKVVERRGNGTTTIDMSLEEVPMATVGG